MEKWSRAYAFVKGLVYYTFWLSHKRISVIGKENIPHDKPIIFTPNHQNALMDPLAVLLTNYTQPVWLARADIFKIKFVRPILRFLKIIPVYRIRDGKENLRNNEATFDLAIRVLENKQSIALFPEAAHTGKKQIISHKKAVPRISFLAEQKNSFNLDVKIIPVGIYYSHYWDFNRSVLVNYGTPIDVAKYKKQFSVNEQAATMALKDEIYDATLPLIINIRSKEYYNEYEAILEIAGAYYFSITKTCNKNSFIKRFYSDKELVNKIESFEQKAPEAFNQLITDIVELTTRCKQQHLSLSCIKQLAVSDYCRLITNFILAVLSLPVFLPGIILNGLQFAMLRQIIRNKIKDPIFMGSFNFVAGMILFPLFNLIVTIVIGMIARSFLLALFLFLAMPLLGKISYQLLDFYKKTERSLLFAWINIWDKKNIGFLINFKKEIENKVVDAARNN